MPKNPYKLEREANMKSKRKRFVLYVVIVTLLSILWYAGAKYTLNVAAKDRREQVAECTAEIEHLVGVEGTQSSGNIDEYCAEKQYEVPFVVIIFWTLTVGFPFIFLLTWVERRIRVRKQNQALAREIARYLHDDTH